MNALLLSALLASTLSGAPAQLPGEAPALSAALESVIADRIRADLHFLASDSLSGPRM